MTLVLNIAGVIVAFALIIISIKTTLLPRSYSVGLAIFFVVLFRALSRRSARMVEQRRQQELDELKRTRVLDLDQ